MSQRTRKVLIIVLVVVGLLALYMVIQRATTEPAKAATPLAAKKMSDKQIHALVGASLQLAAGDEKKARATLRDAFGGPGWQMRIPFDKPRKTSKRKVVFRPGATRRAGCATGYVEGKIETSVVGFDVLKASTAQSWCWRDGQITSTGDLKTYQHVTQWGALMNWHEDGIRRGSHGWTDYGGKNHGGHYANVVASFKACAPVPTGCILPKQVGIRTSLLLHGDGRFWTSVG